MKKMLALILAAVLVLSMGACGGPEKKTEAPEKEASQGMDYKTYETGGLSFELPAQWPVEETEDGLESDYDEYGFFTIWSQEVKADEFDVFSQEFIPQIIQQESGVEPSKIEKTSYASHPAYNYEVETKMEGIYTVVKFTSISVGDKAVISMMAYTTVENEEIYNHFLASIR